MFKEGHKKVGGRQAGGLNKSTEENNKRIDRVLKILDKTLDKDIQELKGEERIKTWLILNEHRSAKLARIEVNQHNSGEMTVHVLRDGSND